MGREFIFALCQMGMKEDKEYNISKAEAMIEQSVKQYNASMVGLPELFNTQYFPQWLDNKYFELAEPLNGYTITRISKKAEEHGIYIFSPIYERTESGIYYNSSVLLDPNGKIISIHRKMHLPFIYLEEEDVKAYEKYYYSPGNEFSVVQTKFGKIGQLICYDRHFPEAWRILALKGAELIFIPMASMGKTLEEMLLLETRALACLNQCFACVVNRVGMEGKLNFYGKSHIVDPTGKLLCLGNQTEQVLWAKIDLDMVSHVRKRINLLRDYRPELYAQLIRPDRESFKYHDSS